MRTPNITLFDCFAVLAMSVMTVGSNIACADKEPFTYEKIKEIPAITPTSVLSSRRGDEHGV